MTTSTGMPRRGKKLNVTSGPLRIPGTKASATKGSRKLAQSPGKRTEEVRIGGRLKHARLIKGLRLQDLANLLDCSESFLSKIENNKVRPSLSMLHQITVSLDISISTLFAGQNEAELDQIQIMRATERHVIRTNPARKGPGIALERLVAMERNTLLEANIHCVEAGGHTDGTISHEGEEVGYLLEGELELELNGIWYSLKQGDSFFFQSSIPHGYRNPGKKMTRVLWVNTPPTF